MLSAQPAWPEQSHDHRLYAKVGTHYREAEEEQVIERAQALVTKRLRPGAPILSPQEIQDILRLKLAPRHRATFAALAFDYRLRLIDYVEIFRGTTSGVTIHIREIVRELLTRNAGAVLFARNDPSGGTEPSESDVHHFRYLRDGLALIDIRVLDYFVIGPAFISLADESLRLEKSGRAVRSK